MTILLRNKLSSVSPPFSNEGSSEIALSEAKRGDPSSHYFQYPSYLLPLTPFKLDAWLQECHYKAKLRFIAPFERHTCQAKKLIDNHSHGDLIRAVVRASQVSKYPFTLKFVERILDDSS